MLAYGESDDHDDVQEMKSPKRGSSSPTQKQSGAAGSASPLSAEQKASPKGAAGAKGGVAPHEDSPQAKGQQPHPHDANKTDRQALVTPIFSAVLFIVVITLILVGAGAGTSGKARTKAVIFILDGLKATVFEEVGVRGYRAPNLQKIVKKGSHAACVAKTDTRCCRAQTGARLGPPYTWESAPGMASILTGVDSPKHEVYNASFDSLLRFASSSAKYPTWLKIATDAGLTVGAVGANAFLTTVGPSGSCTAYGVADFECGAAALSRCMRSDSCNLKKRLPISPTSDLPDVAAQSDITRDVLGLIDSGADVIVVHIPHTNLAATTVGSFASASRPYVAQLYYADAIIGMVQRTLEQRSRDSHESWLLMMTSDHGGHDKTFGTRVNDDDIVPLVAAVFTPGGYADLADPVPPVRQMDVAPTVLQWLGILTDKVAANFDGRTQFVCGATGNCTSLTSTTIAARL